MQDPRPNETGRHDGGTYAQDDLSPAAERSRFRTTQNYRSTSGQIDQAEAEGGEQVLAEPGAQLDSGGS